MKVFVAVVASVTDYRKDNSVYIDCSSVHKTKRDAKICIMNTIAKASPSVALTFPLKFEQVFEETITEGRKIRLQELMRNGGVELEFLQDDVPEDMDDKEFEAFEKKEMKVLEELSEKLTKFLNSNEQLPFQDIDDDFKIPELPNGQYVCDPIVYRIEEHEIEIAGKRGRQSS